MHGVIGRKKLTARGQTEGYEEVGTQGRSPEDVLVSLFCGGHDEKNQLAIMTFLVFLSVP